MVTAIKKKLVFHEFLKQSKFQLWKTALEVFGPQLFSSVAHLLI